MASVPRSVLITGANRGIGLEMVKHFLKLQQRPEILFATYRTKETAKELLEIAKEDNIVRPIQLDVKNYSSFPAVVEQVSSAVGKGGLNLLINNAGVIPSGGNKLLQLTPDLLIEAYQVNSVSPVILTQAFIPLLKAAAESGYGQEFTWSRAAVINVSSTMGSISNATESSATHYRMSKVALNMFTKCLSNALRGEKIMAVAIHPGWVQTEMGGPQALISTDTSVSSILKTASQLNVDVNGLFLNYDGKVLPY